MSTARQIGHGSYGYGADGSERYVTWGPVRGLGAVRHERRLAEQDLANDRQDGAVYEVDSDGCLRALGSRMLVEGAPRLAVAEG